MTGWSALVMPVVLGLGFALTAGSAEAPSEGGHLFGKQKAKVKGCGGGKEFVTWDAVLKSTGTWSMFDGVNTFTGTSVATGKGGKYDLSFDGPSEAAFIDSFESGASSACDTTITVLSSERKKFQLKVNKKATKAKVLLRYKFLGGGGGRTGKAQYSGSAKGAWGPTS